MILTQRDNEIRYTPVAIVCDICQKKSSFEEDILTAQEFISIRKRCGYGSIFGDGTTLSLDICEDCFNKMIQQATGQADFLDKFTS